MEFMEWGWGRRC